MCKCLTDHIYVYSFKYRNYEVYVTKNSQSPEVEEDVQQENKNIVKKEKMCRDLN